MEVSRELLEFLSERTGTATRLVASYDEDDIEIVHIKEEVEALCDAADFERMASMLRQEVTRTRAESLFKLGEFKVSLFAFRDGLILHFPLGGNSGVVVSLEAEAAPRFNEFVEECAERIYGS